MAGTKVQRFRSRATHSSPGRVTIPVPFDPAAVWGRRDRYHLTGTIEGVRVRALLVLREGNWLIELGPKSPSRAGLRDGQSVAVILEPEGPQSEELAPDIAAALAARPRAHEAFDGLATFYRKGWLRWINGTKRRPDLRAARIAEMVHLVESGHKEWPARR